MIKKYLWPIMCAAFTVGIQAQEYKEMIEEGNHTIDEIQESAEAYFATRGKGRGTGYKQFKRWEYNAVRMQDENGLLKSDSFYFDELERYNNYLNQNRQSSNLISNANWTELGPSSWNATRGWNPGVGRITSIGIDKGNTDHIIVGGQTGGIWKTTNKGTVWTPLTDNHNNLVVYSLTIDPTNSSTYYWGSSRGRIYKSTNAGSTWTPIANAGVGRVVKILIHPTNAAIMFAASEGSGVYRTTDGGNNWSSVGTFGGYDIEFKPGEPNTIFVSGTNVMKSTDGGANFSAVAGFNNGPKMIAVSANNPEYVYVIEASSGRFKALYRSTDSGTTFNDLGHTKNYFGYSTLGDDDQGQAPRDMDIAVSPTNENEVHIAGVNTWKSTNGGVDFLPTSDWVPGNAAGANIGYCHADVDILEFIGNTLYVGSDGGIYISEDTSVIKSDYYRDITSGLGIRQFYKIGISQTASVVVSGGSQDNGTSFYNSTDGWRDWLGADGMESFIDKADSQIMYGTSQNGSLYISTNGGISLGTINRPEGKTGNWITPFEQDPTVNDVIYSGYDQVYKSNDRGITWTAISQNFGSNLDHLKIAPSNNQIMFAAYGNRLFKTETASGVWTQLSGISGNINSIAIHPTDANKVAVATSGSNKVYVSNDGGATWVSYLKNLPNFSALSLVWQNNADNGLYVGMNYGIYYIDDSFTDWQSYSNNIPNVIVNELEINTADNKIYAGTYGRGLWSSPVFNATLSVSEHQLYNTLSIYPNPSENNITINWNENFDVELRLFDINGRIVYYEKDKKLNTSQQIDISHLNSGFYFLRINSKKGIATRKIIKK